MSDMNEQRETLSALMDGEASEIEVHRVLRQIGDNESLKQTWLSWHQARTVIRSRGGERYLGVDEHLALHARIREAIADEDTYTHKGTMKPGWSAYRRPAAALGFAASLAVAVLVGMQLQSPAGSVAGLAGSEAPAVEATPVSAPAVAADLTAPEELDSELRELDEAGRQRLRAYLQQHDRMMRMKNDTQYVTYPDRNQ